MLCLSVLVTAWALRAFFIVHPARVDFTLFVHEGRQWNQGQPLYATVTINTNSPAMTVTLFSVLARMPYPIAQGLWVTLSVIALWSSWRLIARELGWSVDRTATAVGLGLLMHGSYQAFSVGQLTIPLLLYPVSRAWVAYRRQRFFEAGCWLGPAIVMKPPLALAALLLRWPTWTVAGTLSLGLSLASLPITGLAPWRLWLNAGGRITWLDYLSNLSFWGVAAKWTGGHMLTDLSPIVVGVVLFAGAVLGAHVLVQKHPDRRVLGALLWSVLLSPLGWVHYLVLLIGPVAALWRGTWLTWTAYALLLLPFGGYLVSGPVFGSLYCVAVLLLWFDIAMISKRRERLEAERPAVTAVVR